MKGGSADNPLQRKTCEIRIAELGGRKHKLLNCATLTLPILREHMNHGEGWIFVTAVISASKRNNFSSDFRGVSRKFVSSANRILNFSMIFARGAVFGAGPTKEFLKPPWWPHMVKGLGGFVDHPEVSQAAFWWLWGLLNGCVSWIFLISKTKKRRQYKNIKMLNHSFLVWMIKNDALKFSALQSSGVLFLAVTKLQFHPQSWLTGSV